MEKISASLHNVNYRTSDFGAWLGYQDLIAPLEHLMWVTFGLGKEGSPRFLGTWDCFLAVWSIRSGYLQCADHCRVFLLNRAGDAA